MPTVCLPLNNKAKQQQQQQQQRQQQRQQLQQQQKQRILFIIWACMLRTQISAYRFKTVTKGHASVMIGISLTGVHSWVIPCVHFLSTSEQQTRLIWRKPQYGQKR
jgi:uncharacterized membrane protein